MTGFRPGSERRELPFLTLPRTGAIVEFFVQRAKTTAGCAICDRPIAPGQFRMSIVVKLPEARSTGGRSRNSERFYIHGGCLMEVLEGRPLRTGRDCFDCGTSAPGVTPHAHRCYTTSRFAIGFLCSGCARKRRWRFCHSCETFFPPPMVSPVVGIVEDVAAYEDIDEGMELCDWCAERGGMKTKKALDEERRNFEGLRDKIARGEVFGR